VTVSKTSVEIVSLCVCLCMCVCVYTSSVHIQEERSGGNREAFVTYSSDHGAELDLREET
jgi:hypothetical protein